MSFHLGMASAQFRFNTPQLAAGSLILRYSSLLMLKDVGLKRCTQTKQALVFKSLYAKIMQNQIVK
jgi:hypothetical protein